MLSRPLVKVSPLLISHSHQYDEHFFHEFVIFVVGPRNCIGMRFALLEVKVALLAVCKRFFVSIEATVIVLF